MSEWEFKSAPVFINSTFVGITTGIFVLGLAVGITTLAGKIFKNHPFNHLRWAGPIMVPVAVIGGVTAGYAVHRRNQRNRPETQFDYVVIPRQDHVQEPTGDAEDGELPYVHQAIDASLFRLPALPELTAVWKAPLKAAPQPPLESPSEEPLLTCL